MSKKVLFVDLGDVLIQFEERFLKAILRPEKFNEFLLLVHEYDKGNIELFNLHARLTRDEYFIRPISWGEFIQAYANCIYDVHTPMFLALSKLKARGINLVCLTDNNHFCFYITSYKFPRVCELFHENGKENWMLSYKFHSLKQDPSHDLFNWLPSKFGFALKNAAFVDNVQINLDRAVEAGFRKNSVFLYNRYDIANHEEFEKVFLHKHFPAK